MKDDKYAQFVEALTQADRQLSAQERERLYRQLEGMVGLQAVITRK